MVDHTEEILLKVFVCFAKQFDFILKAGGGRDMTWPNLPFLKLSPSGMWEMDQWRSQTGGRKIVQEAFAIFHIWNERRSGWGPLQRGLNAGSEFLGDCACGTLGVRDRRVRRVKKKEAPKMVPKFLSQTAGEIIVLFTKAVWFKTLFSYIRQRERSRLFFCPISGALLLLLIFTEEGSNVRKCHCSEPPLLDPTGEARRGPQSQGEWRLQLQVLEFDVSRQHLGQAARAVPQRLALRRACRLALISVVTIVKFCLWISVL